MKEEKELHEEASQADKPISGEKDLEGERDFPDQSRDANEKNKDEARDPAEEYLAGWKRCLADFDNYKKQQAKTFMDLQQYATEDFIREIVPVLDSFDLALRAFPEDEKTKEWKQGAFYIKGQLEDVLKSRGLVKIKAAGEPFDPEIHEAVESVESEKKSGTIIEEIQPGYKIGERVIRPARVKIAK